MPPFFTELLANSRDFLLLRKYQGYYVITALFIAEMAVTGISFYSFSLFIRAWQNDPAFSFSTAKVSFQFSPNPFSLAEETLRYMQGLMSGWSLAAINFSFSITLPLVFLSPFIGRFVDSRGVKLVMLLGVPLVALSFFLQAFMTQVWHLWAIQVIQGLGQSASFLGTGRLVGLWFQKNRGIIMGFTIAGNNAGGMIMAPLSAYLIQLVGWRTMFLIYGATLFFVNFFVILFFVKDKLQDVIQAARNAGRQEELAAAEAALAYTASKKASLDQPSTSSGGSLLQGFQWREAVRTRAFWLICVAQFASGVSIFAILNQLGKHLQIVGIDISVAGAALGLLGFFGLLGKLIFGYAAEKTAVRYIFAFCLGLQVLGILVLFQVTSTERIWVLFPFAAIYGLGFGAMGALQPLIMLETFGIVAYATILGVMGVILRGANALTPPIVGAAVDATGSYYLVFVATVIFLLFGAITVALAHPPRRKMVYQEPVLVPSSL